MNCKAFLILLALVIMPAYALTDQQQLVINELANKTNVSSESLAILFNITYTREEVNTKLATVNYDIAQVNGTVNIEVQKALHEAANSATSSQLDNITRLVIKPNVEQLNQELRIVIGNVENASMSRLDMRDYTDNITLQLQTNDARIRGDLQGVLDSSFGYLYLFIAAAFSAPTLLLVGLKKSRKVRYRFLGPELGKRLEVQDYTMSKPTKEKHEKLIELKNYAIKKKAPNEAKIRVLRIIDEGYCDGKIDVDKEMQIAIQETNLKALGALK